MTFREAHLLARAYWQRQQRATVPMALLIQCFLNVHRDAEQRREPFGMEEVLAWLGFPAENHPAPPPQRTVEELDAALTAAHQFYTALQASNGEVAGQ